MRYPMDAVYDALGGRLYVADTGNHRVLAWNALPTQLGTAASFVLGQEQMSEHDPNRAGPVTALTMYEPPSLLVHAGSLFVADGTNNRILLVWTPPPTRGDQEPSRVLGQFRFEASGLQLAATSLKPWGMCANGNHLYVADHVHNRVLRFTLTP